MPRLAELDGEGGHFPHYLLNQVEAFDAENVSIFSTRRQESTTGERSAAQPDSRSTAAAGAARTDMLLVSWLAFNRGCCLAASTCA